MELYLLVIGAMLAGGRGGGGRFTAHGREGAGRGLQLHAGVCSCLWWRAEGVVVFCMYVC